MEEVLERETLRKALGQVRRNKGAPGIDGMTVEQLAAHLHQHWPEIRQALLHCSYQPVPVRRVEIPKPSGGGMRQLEPQTPTRGYRAIRGCGYELPASILNPSVREILEHNRPNAA
jgi:RNA-directed DNA polymerase